MVTKTNKTSSKPESPAQAAQAVKGSAQHILAVGLDALTRAQQESGKVIEGFVKEGLSIQRKTQAAAEERLGEATSRVATMATQITSRATGQWDKLEGIFEERVSRALNKLGVPSAKDIEALIARIDELNRHVAQLSAAAAKSPSKAKPTPAASPVAKKSAPAKRTRKSAQ